MKVLKIFILLMMMLAIVCNTSTSYADDSVGDTMTDADDFLAEGKDDLVFSEDDLTGLSNDLYNVLFIIGMAIAVIVGTIMGIQYMMSSVEEKARSKQSLLAYVIGCAVLFGAFAIWKIVVQIFNSI